MSHRLSQEEFVSKVKDIYDDEFDVIDTYVDAKTPLNFKHKKCGTKESQITY